MLVPYLWCTHTPKQEAIMGMQYLYLNKQLTIYQDLHYLLYHCSMCELNEMPSKHGVTLEEPLLIVKQTVNITLTLS